VARTKSRSRTAATVTVNAVDRLTARLNGIDGVEWAVDAWVNEAPENYGVVSLSNEARQLWADGHLTDSAWTVTLDMYVADDSYEYPAEVQEILEALEDEGMIDLTHTNNRDFDYATGKVHWRWMVIMYGPLTWEEPAPTPPQEPEGAGE